MSGSLSSYAKKNRHVARPCKAPASQIDELPQISTVSSRMAATAATPRTWLITGSFSGFGLTLARTVLAHGGNVIATSRNPERTPEYVKEIEASPRGRWLKLDVTSSISTIKAIVEEAAQMFGAIDVLCNNAGYGVMGAAEDIPGTLIAVKHDFQYEADNSQKTKQRLYSRSTSGVCFESRKQFYLFYEFRKVVPL